MTSGTTSDSTPLGFPLLSPEPSGAFPGIGLADVRSVPEVTGNSPDALE